MDLGGRDGKISAAVFDGMDTQEYYYDYVYEGSGNPMIENVPESEVRVKKKRKRTLHAVNLRQTHRQAHLRPPALCPHPKLPRADRRVTVSLLAHLINGSRLFSVFM